MNRPIRIMSVVCLVLFVALLLNVNYVQFVDADDLNSRNGNKRVIDEQFSRDRGPILVAGEPVAESKPSDDQFDYQRVYSKPYQYAHLTGFFSYTYGRSDIEDSENDFLSGRDDRLFVNQVIDLVTSEQPKGGSVALTINARAQQAAYDGLLDLDQYGSGYKGAVAAINPQTGEILALTSRPSYDPNLLASHDLDEVQRAWEDLTESDADPMLDRASQDAVPPGSTFKVITAAAAMEELGLNPNSQVRAGASFQVSSSYTVYNSDGDTGCNPAKLTLTEALDHSCNTTFASLALQSGADALEDTAERFGFNQTYLDSLPMNESTVAPSRSALTESDDYLARAGFGQQDVRATPLQMAVVAAAIANDGVAMRPYVVSQLRGPDEGVVSETEPQELPDQPAISSDTASDLQQMMVSVVQNGTGTSAQISGVEVGGKTGTAERGENEAPYAWFISFAPADDPQVAVAVMVDPPKDTDPSSIYGGSIAAPIARSVMEAVLQ